MNTPEITPGDNGFSVERGPDARNVYCQQLNHCLPFGGSRGFRPLKSLKWQESHSL